MQITGICAFCAWAEMDYIRTIINLKFVLPIVQE
jgi:hypothetical protein